VNKSIIQRVYRLEYTLSNLPNNHNIFANLILNRLDVFLSRKGLVNWGVRSWGVCFYNASTICAISIYLLKTIRICSAFPFENRVSTGALIIRSSYLQLM